MQNVINERFNQTQPASTDGNLVVEENTAFLFVYLLLCSWGDVLTLVGGSSCLVALGAQAGWGATAEGSLSAQQLPAHLLPAPCLGQVSQQWDLPPASVLLSPFLFRKRVSHGTPIPGAGAGLKPSIPHFLSPTMAPGPGLRMSPGLVCLNLRHHVGRLSISPGWEQPCQGWE